MKFRLLARVLKIIVGLLMTVVGLMGLLCYPYPELPIKATILLRSLGEPVGAIFKVWFEFSNSLHTMNVANYLGYGLLFFGLTVAGVLTLWKASRGK